MLRGLTGQLLSVTAALSIFGGPALATKLKSWNGTAPVVVWIDKQAMKDGDRLIKAGVAGREPYRVAPFLSCIVDNGTEVAVTGMHIFSGVADVHVVSGQYAGTCAGVVHFDDLDIPRGGDPKESK